MVSMTYFGSKDIKFQEKAQVLFNKLVSLLEEIEKGQHLEYSDLREFIIESNSNFMYKYNPDVFVDHREIGVYFESNKVIIREDFQTKEIQLIHIDYEESKGILISANKIEIIKKFISVMNKFYGALHTSYREKLIRDYYDNL